MTHKATQQLFSLMRQYGVEYFKSLEVEVRLAATSASVALGAPPAPQPTPTSAQTSAKGPETAAAAPPVEMHIPHEVNQVNRLLKLNDNDLVDALFPLPKESEPE